MHTHNVVHRDLTSNNLLVTDKWEAKVTFLAQIGLAEMPHTCLAFMGSPQRMTGDQASARSLMVQSKTPNCEAVVLNSGHILCTAGH